MRQCLEEARRQLPEDDGVPAGCTVGQAQAHHAEFRGRVGIAFAHELEHTMIEPGSHLGSIAQALRTRRRRRVDPAPGLRPQVGWMDAIGACQFLNLPVLGKQAKRRARPVAQLALQVFEKRETRTLHRRCGLVAADLRPLDELLNGSLHAAHHLRCNALAHHVERAHHLVQLLACHSQVARVQRRHVDAARRLGLVDKALQRLRGRLDGLAGLLEHPRQRAEITRIDDRAVGCFELARHHEFPRSTI